MRNLITLLAVLAFALTAGTALAQCPSYDTIYAAQCGDLPVYGNEIEREDCTDVDWKFEFTRTSQTTGHCIVIIKILGTDCLNEEIDSDYFSVGPHVISGSCVIDDSPIQGTMEHHPVLKDHGLFADLKLTVNVIEL